MSNVISAGRAGNPALPKRIKIQILPEITMPRKAKFNISSISTSKTFPKIPGAITFPEKNTHWRGSGLGSGGVIGDWWTILAAIPQALLQLYDDLLGLD